MKKEIIGYMMVCPICGKYHYISLKDPSCPYSKANEFKKIDLKKYLKENDNDELVD